MDTWGILSADEVQRITRLSRTTVWRLEKEGRFPRRRQVSPKRVGWLREEVEQWLSDLPLASHGPLLPAVE